MLSTGRFYGEAGAIGAIPRKTIMPLVGRVQPFRVLPSSMRLQCLAAVRCPRAASRGRSGRSNKDSCPAGRREDFPRRIPHVFHGCGDPAPRSVRFRIEIGPTELRPDESGIPARVRRRRRPTHAEMQPSRRKARLDGTLSTRTAAALISKSVQICRKGGSCALEGMGDPPDSNDLQCGAWCRTIPLWQIWTRSARTILLRLRSPTRLTGRVHPSPRAPSGEPAPTLDLTSPLHRSPDVLVAPSSP